MANNISTKEVVHIADLLSLPIPEGDIKELAPQLSEAVTYVSVLNELDLTDTPATNQVTGLKNVFRNDELKPSLSQKDALANAKNTYNGYIVVPAVIEKE